MQTIANNAALCNRLHKLLNKGGRLMSKLKKSVGVFLAFMMILTMLPSKISMSAGAVSTTVPLSAYAVVVGDMMEANGYGADWSPSNTKGLMKVCANGVYELILDLKPKSGGGVYEYKIAMNGGWSESYGSSSGGNLSLKLTGEKKVVFRFDYVNKVITDSVNNPDKFKNSATLTGDMEKWNPADTSYDLDYIGGGFYRKTFALKAGKYEYKVAYNHSWGNGEVASNVSLALKENTSVTILANPELGICEDSVLYPEIAKNPSLIGTVRRTGDNTAKGDWNPETRGYEFTYVKDGGVYAYAMLLPAGTFTYKAVNNYSWSDSGVPATGNKTVVVPSSNTYVVFVCDEKSGRLYDSVTDPDETAEALGIKSTVVNGPVLNKNGTVTFNYKNADAKSVYLEGDMTYWADGKKQMKKDSSGNWSVTLRLGDAAKSYAYKFVVDGNEVNDPTNAKTNAKGQSVYDFPGFSGRKVTLPGTIQSVVNGGLDGTWNPAASSVQFTYKGNGLYTLTLKNVPAGSYQYKIALGGSWDENYGQNAVEAGANIDIVVPTKQDVTFTYNDDTHQVVNSVAYAPYNIKLTASEISGGIVNMTNDDLSGIYHATVLLKAGTYSDFKILYNGVSVPIDTFTVNIDRNVVISYDPISSTAFTNLSSKDINENEIYYNSKNSEYKSPYGAVTEGTKVSFALKAAKDDLKTVKAVVINYSKNNEVTVVDMKKTGTFDSEHDKWTATFTPVSKGLYKYYFVMSNGSQVKAYGDDDGYLGSGKTGDIGTVGYYDLNVCEAGYKTPDWLKNAVIYQIFPDRFFDGDTSNDTVKKTSRGSTAFEYHDDWYAEPGNPNVAGSDDGIWCNDIYGGDLNGIDKKLDYLQALGVTALYLNPISESISNHRYDTTDYTKVDAFLGNMDDFVTLANDMHKRGMHLIIDGVYNHVCDDSIYFDRYGKYVESGKPLGAYQYWSAVYNKMNAQKGLSQADAEKAVQAEYKAKGITDFHYKDWFVISNTWVEATSTEAAHYQYVGWSGNLNMPEIQALNGSEENVTTWKEEILDGSSSAVTNWLKKGADGVRLDVANEVSDATWVNFRKSVKSNSANAPIIGEIWTDASKYLLGDMFDSVMNYRYRNAVINYLTGAQSVSTVNSEFDLIREQYPSQAFGAMMNLVDSHDTVRILSTLNNDTAAVANKESANSLKLLKLVPLMQMTYPGAPTIYYGDELGTLGGADPDCRRTMAWGKGSKDIVETYALYGNIHNTYSVLRTGDVAAASVTGSDDVLSYIRTNASDSAVVILNRGNAADGVSVDVSGKISDGTVLHDAVSGSAYTVSNGKISLNLEAVSGVVLVTNYKKIVINEDALKCAYDPSYIVSKRNYESEQKTVTADSLSTVESAKSKGSATIDVTNVSDNANLISVALEQGLKPSFVSGIAVLTLKDRRTAEYINKKGVSSVVFTAVEPYSDEYADIKNIASSGGAGILSALSLTLKSSGINFGSSLYDGANLKFLLGTKYNGKTVYLYYYDKSNGKVEYVSSATVSDGSAEFTIKHLSTYFVTDKLLASGSNASFAVSKVSNPDTGSGGLPVDAAILVVLFPTTTLAIAGRKRKQK